MIDKAGGKENKAGRNAQACIDMSNSKITVRTAIIAVIQNTDPQSKVWLTFVLMLILRY